MQRTFKYLGYSVLVLSVIVSLYLLNLFSKKPYSLDHFLAKELIVGILDSPESMTYLGLFDDYNLIFNHNQRLTISSLEDGKKKYLEDLQRLDTLRKYQVDDLSKNQQITHKIAVFDTEIDIERFEEGGYIIDLYDPYFFPDVSCLNKKYDFITCTETVEHFYSPNKEFHTLNSLLEVGGWLGIMTNFYDDSINFNDWYYRKDPTHVVFYTEETFKFIASMMSWRIEIPTKNVVLFKK